MTGKGTKHSRPSETDVSLGEFVRDARLKQGLTQKDLARAMGFESVQFISDWERGTCPIPMKRLTDLAKHLNLDRDKLFEMLLQFSIDRVVTDMRSEYCKLGKK